MAETPLQKPPENEKSSSVIPVQKRRTFRYLILSFKGLVRALSKGEITIEDLDVALMHFGRTRSYVFYDYQTDTYDPFRIWYPEKRMSERMETRRRLHDAIIKAETEGRIIWRVESEKRTWKKLNILLELNGYRSITIDELNKCESFAADRHKNYNKTAIIVALKSRGETFIYIYD